MTFLKELILILSITLSATSCAIENDELWDFIWKDEFSGDHLDRNNWDFDLGDGCHLGKDLCGWGNFELQYYTNSTKNVYTKDGHLVIEAVKENIHNSTYSSARLVTRNKAQWQFGKIQVRAQFPEGQGLWGAIWMLPTNNMYGEWPRSGEIDIAEVLGQKPFTAHCTAHFGEKYNNKSEKGTKYELSGTTSFTNEFHIFEIIWEDNKITWFIDNNKVQEMIRSDTDPFVYPFNEDFYLLLNLAVGGNWVESPDEETKFPAQFKVDYVRVYKKR